MAGWLALMLSMAVLGREATRALDVFQVMEIRSLIGILMIYPLVRAAGGFKAMKTARPMRHVTRNAVHYCAQFSWFSAITLITLAEVVAIEFTMPIWTAVIAVVFLGETMNRWKVAAVALGLVGVWIIVRPEASTIETGQVWALTAAIGFAISVALVKTLTRSDDVVRIVFWMLIIQSIIGLVPAIMVWKPVEAHIWPYLLAVAFCGAFSHYCMARAMVYADTTVVVPMDFLRVPLTAIAGWLLYSEGIDAFTISGAGLILLGNLLNLKQAGTARMR